MNRIGVFSTIIALLILSGCVKKKKHLSESICVTNSFHSSSIEVNDHHLEFFKNNMQFIEQGQYLAGIYSLDSELVFTSVYTGPKIDSIVSTIAPDNVKKNQLGSSHYWWTFDGRLYVYSINEIVCISFPESQTNIIVPHKGESQFITLCD